MCCFVAVFRDLIKEMSVCLFLCFVVVVVVVVVVCYFVAVFLDEGHVSVCLFVFIA